MKVKNGKSLLAKLLATENIEVVYAPVETASFAPVERVLTIPIYKTELTEDEIDLFIGHEVGHALFTPAESPKKWVKNRRGFMSFINIVEDARIEKLMQRKFPGLRRNFKQGYKDLVNRQFFGDYRNESLSFIDRVNIFFKTGDTSIQFSEVEQKYIDKIQNIETWDEAVEVTEDLYKYCEELQKEKGEDKDEEKEKENNPTNPNQPPKQVQDDCVEDEEDEEDEDEDKNTNAPDNSMAQNIAADPDEEKDEGAVDELDSETERMLETNMATMVEGEGVNVHDVKIPSLETAKNQVADFDYIERICQKEIYSQTDKSYYEKIWKKFSANQKSIVNYMAKEFEMKKRAEEYKRTKTAKTGRLNMGSLHKYRFSEDIFARNEIVKDGKSHGFFMVVDWSGSMQDCIKDVISQIQVLVMFCQKVNVPFEVYAFTTQIRNLDEYERIAKDGEIYAGDCGLMHLASSTMSRSRLYDSMVTLTTIKQKIKHSCPHELNLGGTPLTSAIMLSTSLAKEFKRKNGLDILNTIFLTDGAGHSSMRYKKDGNFSEYMNLDDYITVNGKYDFSRLLNGTDKIDNAFFNIMRKETGCNLIGYYMISGESWYIQSAVNTFCVDDAPKVKTDEVSDNAFYKVPCKVHFYDELFIVISNKLFVDEDEGFSNSVLSIEEITKSFGEQRKNKINARSFLKKFMELLS
jgi:hypothetical protein